MAEMTGCRSCGDEQQEHGSGDDQHKKHAPTVAGVTELDSVGDDDEDDAADIQQNSFALCSSFSNVKRSRITNFIFGGGDDADVGDGTEKREGGG
uniref:Uncharacterized protein n=1 Tax=Oryza sativa subsp. japonica TaxID=39947 RepID=Q6EQV4_ORYSJ|nr:hypothetical protein [Oryza sativa Japonica Group]